MNTYIEIENYDDLIDQFGVIETDDLISAPEQLKKLREIAIKDKFPDHIILDCNQKSEAICVFTLESISTDKSFVLYVYNGTAN